MGRPKGSVNKTDTTEGVEQTITVGSTSETVSTIQPVTTNPWREEVSADLKAIMHSIGDLAKEIGELRKTWASDMETVKRISKSGKF